MELMGIATRNVVTVTADATVREAARLMREHHVGDVVIVEANEGGSARPVGILTDRDIVLSTIALGIDPSIITVEDVMSPALVTARSTDGLERVLALMKEAGIKRVPIVGEGGDLEGIVSAEDLTSLLTSELGDIVKIKERQRDIEVQRRRKVS